MAHYYDYDRRLQVWNGHTMEYWKDREVRRRVHRQPSWPQAAGLPRRRAPRRTMIQKWMGFVERGMRRCRYRVQRLFFMLALSMTWPVLVFGLLGLSMRVLFDVLREPKALQPGDVS